jgi:outer membrane protein TolC
MSRLQLVLCGFALALAFVLPVAAQTALTLSDALQQAMATHPDERRAEAEIEAAERGRDAISAGLLPSIDLQANASVWDSEQTLSLGGGGAAPALPPPATPYELVVAGIANSLGSGSTVRELFTSTTSLQLTQPLTPMVALFAAKDAATAEISALEAQREGSRRAIQLAVFEAYFRVQQALAVAETAGAAVSALQARAKTAAAYLDAGLFGKNDVLKVQVALSAAEQEAIAASNNVKRAKAALALAMGLDSSADFALVTRAPTWAEGEGDTAVDAVVSSEADTRPELAAVRARIEQARHGVDARKSAYIPDVVLVANYTHTEGSQFQQRDAFFAGLALEWNLFRWGGTQAGVEQAAATARSLEALEQRTQQALNFEVESALLHLDTTRRALEVAKIAVEQAQEAARLERARFESQKATSTDVLDAELALTQSQLRLDAARFERILAQARLRHAMGQPLEDTQP